MKYNLQTRYILIGDSYVGKSCIIEQYIDRYFSLGPTRTLGVDFHPINNLYDISGNIYNINNHIFDTGGDIKMLHLYKDYILRSKCILLVFDLTNIQSLTNLKKWHNIISNFNYSNKFILVGNKSDSKKRTVKNSVALKYAYELNIEYIEITAKSKKAVDYLFNKLNTDFIKDFSQLRHNKINLPNTIGRSTTFKEKDTGCCYKICNIS